MKAKRLLFCIFVLILVLVISAMPASATGTANNLNQMSLKWVPSATPAFRTLPNTCGRV